MPGRDTSELAAAVIRRRRLLRGVLAGTGGVLALVAGLDHLGGFKHVSLFGLRGYAGPDWSRYDRKWARVQRVLGGDCVELAFENGGPSETARLLGISIELRPPWSERAAAFLSRRTVGQRVLVRLDAPQTRDSDGRLLVYLYVDQELVNRELIERGLAHVPPHRPHSLRQSFEQAERSARQARIGLWASPRP